MTIFKRRLSKKKYKVKESFAARAIYVAGDDDLHKISLTFKDVDGEVAEFELNLVDTGKLISQLKTAYNAALPRHHRETFQ